MKHLFFSIALTSILLSCNTTKETTKEKSVVTYANTITLNELKTNLYTFASDDFTGRETGEEGQKLAAEFLKKQYKDYGIQSPIGNDDYFQEIPKSFLPGGVKASENVVAYIEGTSKPDEIVVISAHYDHLGTDAVDIFNGADDDGSGTVAVLEIAQAFKKAKNEGNGPKRSILFLHLTAEEKGLYGSKWYVQNPLFPLKNHVANLNIDMIGRVDDAHMRSKNYVYLIGSDKLSTELHNISEQVNTEFVNLNLDYTYNDENDPNRFYYRSDHYNFAKNNIPIIFYFNGVHKDYHKPTDTAEKINYELLTKRTKLVFHTAWEIANRENRVIVDIK
ncbi:M28 family metallopeptidase [Flavicella sp.]|uniref:M28 family metallopeptidase n=1 Tax=Flavicella sp. TaxID=2957742 RepID=UPI0026084B57|nr:M28 family metallopeptidase [Flavicella sp.]MDG1805478.1 M28 family metallopeptidase [Flavicella sp.]MDG2279306.1 M28 family metallopeptidase [Flavicella sp.]